MFIAKEVLLAFTNLREYRRARTSLVITAALNVWGERPRKYKQISWTSE